MRSVDHWKRFKKQCNWLLHIHNIPDHLHDDARGAMAIGYARGLRDGNYQFGMKWRLFDFVKRELKHGVHHTESLHDEAEITVDGFARILCSRWPNPEQYLLMKEQRRIDRDMDRQIASLRKVHYGLSGLGGAA